MLSGDFDASAAVRQLAPYAVVNGVRREVESVALDRELSHDLPEQVGGANGLGKASGTIVWVPDDDVVHRPVSPWRPRRAWPPRAGDQVRVYVTDGVTSYPRFTGVIDENFGDPQEPGFTSKVIDFRDRLNRREDMVALLRHHTPYLEGPWRSVGLNHFYVLTEMLRKAGVYNTPPTIGQNALSVPMQGSLWPEVGIVTDVYGTVRGNHALFRHTPWGYAAAGFSAWYNPSTAHRITAPTQLSLQLGEDHAGIFYFEVRYSTGQRIRLRGWTGSRGVTAQYYDGTTWTSVAALSHAHMAGATTVSLLVKNGVWELRNDAHVTMSASQPVSGGSMDEIYVYGAEDARVSSIGLVRPSATQEHRPLVFTPQMMFQAGTLVNRMDMSPRMVSEMVAPVVDEICKATLTGAWWDEMGVLQLVASDVLQSRGPVQTITTRDDITRLQWSESLRSVRRAVSVTWEDAAISKGRQQRKELFRGSKDSMESGDTIEVFATPANDREWFGADFTLRRLDDLTWGAYNRPRGSMMGVYYINDDNEELATSSRTTTIRLERINQVTLKITHIAGSYGSGVEANLGVSENSEVVRESLRGDPLPVIRGYGEGVWVDETTTSAALGPAHAPDLTHDLGRWGHRYASGSAAQRVADWLMDQLATPKPMITGLEVLYDPRRQLGDVYIIDSEILGIQLRVSLVGLREHLTHAHSTQDFTVRIIDIVGAKGITYDELADAWEGGDYDAFQAVWANLTYTDLETSPEEGSPGYD